VVALLVIGALLAGVALAIAGHALVIARQRMVANVAGIERYGFTSAAALDDPESRSVLQHLASLVGDAVARRFGVLREADLRQQLVSAGMYSLSARMLFGYQVLGSVALPAVWLWLSVTSGAATALVVLGTIVAAGFGWVGPVAYVRRRARMRLAEIDFALPELIDLIVVSIEAGLGFAGSLRVASERMREGPLGVELRLANQEQLMGLPTTDSLENMLARCPTDMMRSFVRAVVEGERLGVSIGQIMRNLAVEMRKSRRQLAEERAHKAPVKILFPLVFMIFPAMFLVLLGPAVFQIIDSLGNR
jgi:tight adherence protein C